MKGLKILIPLVVMGSTLWLRSGSAGFANIPQTATTEDIVVSAGLGVITSMLLQSI